MIVRELNNNHHKEIISGNRGKLWTYRLKQMRSNLIKSKLIRADNVLRKVL